jgi:hypothetical protein
MDLADPRWNGLKGGYGIPFDSRPALRRLADGDAAVGWDELWLELYHQGDVGEASYAVLPELIRIHHGRATPNWNLYAFAAAVEEARRCGNNPDVPEWLRADYDAAWGDLEASALADFSAAAEKELVQSLIAVLALAKGWLSLARLALLTEDEREQILSERG